MANKVRWTESIKKLESIGEKIIRNWSKQCFIWINKENLK